MNHPAERTYFDLSGQPIANATKTKIIETAIDLFSQRGFSGASIRDITKAVGIKESSLYKHFANKDEMLETIFVNFRRETDKLLPPLEHIDRIAESMSLAAFLEKGIDNFLKHIDDPINQKVWRIMYIELFRHPMAQDIYRNAIMERTVECLALVFEKMIKQRKLKPVNPRTLATEYQYSSISFILAYNMRKLNGESTEQLEQEIREHVRFFAAAATGRETID